MVSTCNKAKMSSRCEVEDEDEVDAPNFEEHDSSREPLGPTLAGRITRGL